MAGFDVTGLRRDTLHSEEDVIPLPNKWRFLKAQLGTAGSVRELPHQGSHMITSLSKTDSLIVVPPSEGVESAGEIETYRLPYAEDNT
jgi:molybdopterin biosynthesis enzyme